MHRQVLIEGDLTDGLATPRRSPRRTRTLTGLSGVLAIDGGLSHTCAMASTDLSGVYCWGEGTSGQLGTGSETDASRPIRVAA